MRVTIEGVGVYEVSGNALPQLLNVINSNKAVSISENEHMRPNTDGVQLINE